MIRDNSFFAAEVKLCQTFQKLLSDGSRSAPVPCFLPYFLPEMNDGIAGELPISDNLISSYFERQDINNKLFMDGKAIQELSNDLIDKFAVKTDSAETSVNSLSGGNIQKVVVAREWNTSPNLMIAEQPTHGIDIGSAEFVHHRLIDLRNEGTGILLVSADLNEVMDLPDRIIVMFNGKIAAYFKDANNVTEQELGMYMLGAKAQTKEEIGGALND